MGAGPGNPDLITVKGMKLIQDADVIFYDALIDFRVFKNLINRPTGFLLGKGLAKYQLTKN